MVRVSAVVMAAGFSRRMGVNKLLIKLNDQYIVDHLIAKYPGSLFYQSIAVYSDQMVGDIFKKGGFKTLLNSSADEKCVTIKIGTEACFDADGIIFFVADQPFLKVDTIKKLIFEFNNEPDKIIIPMCDGKNRNPVIFPKSVFRDLLNLKGDLGGRDVIKAHPELVKFIRVDDVAQFLDIDTPEDLEKAKELAELRK